MNHVPHSLSKSQQHLLFFGYSKRHKILFTF